MSFFPAGLSLVIELMFNKAGRPTWDVKQIIKSLPSEEIQNPAVYRVRVIAMKGLAMVHTLSRWPVEYMYCALPILSCPTRVALGWSILGAYAV